jgi:hypothetical protein
MRCVSHYVRHDDPRVRSLCWVDDMVPNTISGFFG